MGLHPADKTRDEIFQSVQRRLFLPKPVHAEVIQHRACNGTNWRQPPMTKSEFENETWRMKGLLLGR
jgi:hypothetical protein